MYPPWAVDHDELNKLADIYQMHRILQEFHKKIQEGKWII